MTHKEAKAESVKRWGKRGTATFNDLALTKAEKEPYLEILRKAREKDPSVSKADRAKASGMVLGFRCSVGVMVSIGGIQMNHIKGQGDTWEEAFSKCDKE